MSQYEQTHSRSALQNNQGRPLVTGHLHPTTTKIPHGSDQSVGRTNFGLGALTG